MTAETSDARNDRFWLTAAWKARLVPDLTMSHGKPSVYDRHILSGNFSTITTACMGVMRLGNMAVTRHSTIGEAME